MLKRTEPPRLSPFLPLSSLQRDGSGLLGVLGAEFLSRVHHVDERGLGLLPFSGLQTTVGVDPELIWTEVLKHLTDATLDLLLTRDTRRVDIIYTRTNVARIGLIHEDLEQLGIALAVLDGQDISVKRGDRVEEVLELGVTEMGVDLGGVANASGGKAESTDGPFEVVITRLSSTERKTFTKGRLIDLDDVDASSFQVNNLVTKSKRQLLSLDRLVDIVTRERPPETGDGTREHALHGLLGDRGSVFRFLDGHRARARDISDDDRGTHATRAVALNPGVGGEDIASQSLAEVLDHIVTLRFSVDKYIEVELLLDLNDVLDLLLDEFLVLLGRDLALGELVSLDTDLGCLREGADGSSGEEREIELFLLLGDTIRELALTVAHLLSDGRLSLTDFGVICSLRRRTALHRPGVSLHLVANGSRPVSHSFGNDGQFDSFFGSKAEPIPHLGVEVLLAVKSVRGVQEGAGACYDDTVFAELLNCELDNLDGLLEVGLPDVAAVHHTGGQSLVRAKSADNSIQLLRVADKVDVDGVKVLEVGENVNVVNNVTEIGGQNKARSLVTQGT